MESAYFIFSFLFLIFIHLSDIATIFHTVVW